MGAITRGIANNILGNGAVDGTDALTGTIPATNIGNTSLANLTTFPPSVDAGIPQVAGDPPAPSEGDVWYNTNTYKLKVRGLAAGTWATGGNLNTARNGLGGVGATKDAALAFGGGPPPAPTATAITESYNGSAWTEVNDLNSQRAYAKGVGTQTAAIAAGGDQYSGVAESWNGTSWTSVSNEPDASNNYGTAGADNTNALFFGGNGAVPAANSTRYWNGSAWTALANINTARGGIAGAGNTYTAALAATGNYSSTRYTNVESFNGTSWTEITDANTARNNAGGAGTQTSALIFGGNIPPSTGATEEWNGSSWTETTDLSTARHDFANAGSGTTNALAAGGSPTTAATEEWSKVEDNLDVDLA